MGASPATKRKALVEHEVFSNELSRLMIRGAGRLESDRENKLDVMKWNLV